MIVRYCIYHGEIVLAEHGEKVMRFPIPGRHIEFVGNEKSYEPTPIRFAKRTVRTLSVDCSDFHFASALPLYAMNLIRKREKMDLREQIHRAEKAVRDALSEYLNKSHELGSFKRNWTGEKTDKYETLYGHYFQKRDEAARTFLAAQLDLWHCLYVNGFITEDEFDSRLCASIEERIEMAMRMAERNGGRA